MIKEEIAVLLRRIDLSIEQQVGIKLNARELDVLVAAGLYELLHAAMVKEMRTKAEARLGTATQLRNPAAPMPSDDGRPPPPFTPDRLAQHWGVSKSQVYNHLRSGALKHFRIGELYRITPDAVAEFERQYGVGKK